MDALTILQFYADISCAASDLPSVPGGGWRKTTRIKRTELYTESGNGNPSGITNVIKYPGTHCYKYNYNRYEAKFHPNSNTNCKLDVLLVLDHS